MFYILSDKRNATAKNQSCFIQTVISSNYVEINQQIFAVSCFEGLSNFVQRNHQTGENQGRNLTSRMPFFKLEFPEDMETLKDKEGTRQSWVIERLTTLTFCHKNSHPHICLCHAIHVSKLTLTSTTTTPQGKILIHEKWFKLLLHISQTSVRW